LSEYLQAFLLGNAAILGNVCVLPLYPGLIAFLGGTASGDSGSRIRPFLGLAVLAGVLSVMIAIGWILYRLQLAFGQIFDWFLPLVFGLVALLGPCFLGAIPLPVFKPFRHRCCAIPLALRMPTARFWDR
jgi:cytochrome c-type biogenesis protein